MGSESRWSPRGDWGELAGSKGLGGRQHLWEGSEGIAESMGGIQGKKGSLGMIRGIRGVGSDHRELLESRKSFAGLRGLLGSQQQRVLDWLVHGVGVGEWVRGWGLEIVQCQGGG